MRQLPLVLALTGTLIACSSEKPSPKTPATQNEAGAQLSPLQEDAVAKAQKEAGAQGLSFDDEIVRLCPNVSAPKFAYNSANVNQRFRSSLVELAKCMNDGGLKGRKLLLVGHADPRGEEDYNLALGGRRAGSVHDALGALGVSTTRMDTTSRGELDSKGTDESSWKEDRRVDVRLAAR